MSRIDELNKTLSNLQASSSDMEACAIVSEDGLIIASSLPQGVEEERIAAMSAAMLSMGERIAHELKRGDLEQLYVKGQQGYFLSMHAGTHAVLIALVRQNAKLGLIFFDLNKAAEAIKAILS
ncbi:MAG: roadblock/LC7 domain-containing protein [Desulfuromonadales bacterium]|jgi:predicted regulator of Ras-like GTPase activity (Roadblock/LC7/MglB family)